MKKVSGAQIWTKQAKIGTKVRSFYHFLKFGSLVFLEISYKDSLQWCVTSSTSKAPEKNFWGQNLIQN